MIWKLMMDIHKLLDLPDSAAAEILTLDFGAANQAQSQGSLAVAVQERL